ncbi:hypothetical protein V6O07_11665, partial [Arthrospira platensis SPKY2]
MDNFGQSLRLGVLRAFSPPPWLASFVLPRTVYAIVVSYRIEKELLGNHIYWRYYDTRYRYSDPRA